MTRSNGLSACILVKLEHDILQFQPLSISNRICWHFTLRVESLPGMQSVKQEYDCATASRLVHD